MNGSWLHASGDWLVRTVAAPIRSAAEPYSLENRMRSCFPPTETRMRSRTVWSSISEQRLVGIRICPFRTGRPSGNPCLGCLGGMRNQSKNANENGLCEISHAASVPRFLTGICAKRDSGLRIHKRSHSLQLWVRLPSGAHLASRCAPLGAAGPIRTRRQGCSMRINHRQRFFGILAR